MYCRYTNPDRNSAYFHAGLMQLEEIIGNCINFACYLLHLLLHANIGNL